MAPEEFAKKFPKLYHVTRPDAVPLIRRHGLLSTSALLDLFEIFGENRKVIETQRRKKSIQLNHPKHGLAWISDNKPLYVKSLEKSLDDGLSVSDWLRILNERIFFWPRLLNAKNLRNAENYRDEDRLVLEVDTLAFARKYDSYIEICPINSGAASRIAARRGLSTFAPLRRYTYNEWQKLRPKKSLDIIQEVTVTKKIPDIFSFAKVINI